jgi:hypothetical protein
MGATWAKTTYKEQTIETETKMAIMLQRLLRANEKRSNKSFFCMYLIRPSLSPAIAGLRSPIVQYERRFDPSLKAQAYRMTTKNLEKKKIFLAIEGSTQTLATILHLMFVTLARRLTSFI